MSTNKPNTKKTNTETVTEETAKPITPNEVKTQEQFAQTNVLDMMALNNDLMALNKGELRFKVIKKGNYEFNKTDKDNNPIPTRYPDGSPMLDENGKQVFEQIRSPYVEVIGEGINGKISSKKLDKDEIQLLQVGQNYIGTYILNENLEIVFTSVVPFNLELESRLKHSTNRA